MVILKSKHESNIWIKLFLLLFFSYVVPISAQQKNTFFEMTYPVIKIPIPHSSYKHLIFLDSRVDTSSVGMVETGLLNQKTIVKAKPALKVQFTKLFSEFIDSSAGDGTLLFQLRQFSMDESVGNTSGTGYCYIRATLYKVSANQYQELDQLDTTISFKALVITKRLYRESSGVMAKFIFRNLTSVPLNYNVISYNDIQHIDSIEKPRLKLYSASEYKNGLYKTYHSFKNQEPDFTNFTCEKKNGFLNILKIEDEQGKKIVIKKAFAMVYESKPYIIIDEGIYPLRKEGGSLCFVGPYKVSGGQITGKQIAAIAAIGVFGIIAVPTSNQYNSYFDIRLDPLSGEFIPIRQINGKELKEKKKVGEIPRHKYNEASYNDGY